MFCFIMKMPNPLTMTRQDQRDICILQTGFHEHGISRDDGDRPRNHHRHHDKAEDNIFPFKLILAEYISAQAACIDHNRCNRYGNEDTVHEIPQKIKGLLEIHVVVDGRLLREQRPGRWTVSRRSS